MPEPAPSRSRYAAVATSRSPEDPRTSEPLDAESPPIIHHDDIDPAELLALAIGIASGPAARSTTSDPGRRGDTSLEIELGSDDRLPDPTSTLRRVLGDEGGLAALARRSLGSLISCGISADHASRLRAVFGIAERLAQARPPDPIVLACAADVAACLRPRIGHLDHEEMWLIALDGRNRARAVRRIAMGGLHGCAIAARDVLRVALSEAASSFVLAHNHPSGDPSASPEDIVMTVTVHDAAQLVGVPLVDHVIVARDAHSSVFDAEFSQAVAALRSSRRSTSRRPG